MLLEYLAADPWLAEIRSLALIAENHLPELVCDLAILLPPCTDRIHVVSGSRADRKVWVICRMSESLLDRLRHTLDLERKNPEIVHHLRHRSRNHSEILAACKHSCRIKQGRKLLHGLVLPEFIVATVEEIIIKTVKGSTAICIQNIISLGLLCADLRMIMTFLTRILKEEIEIIHIKTLSLKFVRRIRKRWVEVSVQAALCPERNLPDTEESEDMVDTECIEVLLHLGKT